MTRFAPSAFARSPASVTADGLAGNDHLAGGVEIRGGNHPAGFSRRFVAGATYGDGIKTENGCHRTFADRNSFLHVSPSTAHRAKGIREG